MKVYSAGQVKLNPVLLREVMDVKTLFLFGHCPFGGGGQTHVQKNLDCTYIFGHFRQKVVQNVQKKVGGVKGNLDNVQN